MSRSQARIGPAGARSQRPARRRTMIRVIGVAFPVALAAPTALSLEPFQLSRLSAQDAAAGDWFGTSVGVSGRTIVVGAPFEDAAGSESGAAYLFDLSLGTQLHKLIASDGAANDQLGVAAAIDADTVLLGAWYHDHSATTDAGAAYLFDAATGTELLKLVAPDPQVSHGFGVSVALGGGYAVVGADKDDDAVTNAGAVYIFDAVTGQFLRKLIAPDAGGGDRFGSSVALCGTTLAVGAPLDNDAGENSGSAYLFNVVTGDLLHKVTASDGAAGDTFGGSVALNEEILLAGAEHQMTDRGAVYVYEIATGVEQAKWTADDGVPGDRFGVSVAIDDGTVVIGAPDADLTGAAYAMELDTGTMYKLAPGGAVNGDGIGSSIAVSGQALVLGAPYSDQDGASSGLAYTFFGNLRPPFWWEVNGHYYERITLPSTWQQAQSIAQSVGYDGVVGHLATATSAAENGMMVSNLGGEEIRSHLLGGFQLPNSIEPDQGWRWVTDEAWDYTHWSPDEPNNDGGDESVLIFKGPGSEPLGAWNDVNALLERRGFILEYSVCIADFNRNGRVTSQDFVDFLNAFVAQDRRADINHDGAVNSLDFIVFLNWFVTGC